MHTVLSGEPEAMRLPFGEKEIEVMPFVCPLIDPETSSPLSASQIQITPSADPDAARFPSGEMAIDLLADTKLHLQVGARVLPRKDEWPLNVTSVTCFGVYGVLLATYTGPPRPSMSPLSA